MPVCICSVCKSASFWPNYTIYIEELFLIIYCTLFLYFPPPVVQVL